MPTLSAFLLCDDVRMELSRKLILVGVYAGNIGTSKAPQVVLPKLAAVVMLTETEQVEALRSSGPVVVERTGAVPPEMAAVEGAAREGEGATTLVLTFSPLVLPAPGRYVVEAHVEFRVAGAATTEVYRRPVAVTLGPAPPL